MDAPARPPGLNASRPQFGGLGSRLPLSIQRSSNVRRIAVVFHSAEFPRRQNPRTPTRTLTLTLARTRTRSLAHSAPLSTAPPTAVQHRTPRRSDLIPLRTAGKTAVAPSASASFTSLPMPRRDVATIFGFLLLSLSLSRAFSFSAEFGSWVRPIQFTILFCFCFP